MDTARTHGQGALHTGGVSWKGNEKITNNNQSDGRARGCYSLHESKYFYAGASVLEEEAGYGIGKIVTDTFVNIGNSVRKSVLSGWNRVATWRGGKGASSRRSVPGGAERREETELQHVGVEKQVGGVVTAREDGRETRHGEMEPLREAETRGAAKGWGESGGREQRKRRREAKAPQAEGARKASRTAEPRRQESRELRDTASRKRVAARTGQTIGKERGQKRLAELAGWGGGSGVTRDDREGIG